MDLQKMMAMPLLLVQAKEVKKDPITPKWTKLLINQKDLVFIQEKDLR
jgi:hypothetical protein